MGPVRTVGEIARDRKIEPYKLCGRAPVERQVHIVRRLMIICLEKRSTCCCAAAARTGHKKYRRDTLLNEAVMVGTGEEAFLRLGIGHKGNTHRGARARHRWSD